MSHNKTLKGMKYFSMISFYAIIRCEPLQSLSFKHAFRQRSWAGLVFACFRHGAFCCMFALFYEVLNFPGKPADFFHTLNNSQHTTHQAKLVKF